MTMSQMMTEGLGMRMILMIDPAKDRYRYILYLSL